MPEKSINFFTTQNDQQTKAQHTAICQLTIQNVFNKDLPVVHSNVITGLTRRRTIRTINLIMRTNTESTTEGDGSHAEGVPDTYF